MVRVRKKLRSVTNIPIAKLRKVTRVSKSQARNKFLRTQAAFDEVAQLLPSELRAKGVLAVNTASAVAAQRFALQKVIRRTTQTLTGRLLDYYGITKKEHRAVIQRSMQTYTAVMLTHNAELITAATRALEETMYQTTRNRPLTKNFVKRFTREIETNTSLIVGLYQQD